jgi:hypothetical protein
MMAAQRTGCFTQKIFCAANKLLIRLLVRSHLFRQFADLEGSVSPIVQPGGTFPDFARSISRTFWRIIQQRHSPVYPLRRSLFGNFLDDVLFCFVVNRITLPQFIAARPDLQERIDMVLDRDRWLPLQQFGQSAPSLLSKPKLLESQVEALSQAFASEHFADMLHLALQTVEVVASGIPKDNTPELTTVQILKRGLCWIVTHEDLELFIHWRCFITHFFPKGNRLVDIVGGLDATAWRYYDDIFNQIRQFDAN